MGEAFLNRAKAKAAKYCSLRERAPLQVLEKLFSWEICEDDAQNILNYLIQENFVDESRFCNAFCHDKFEFNQWGRNRIRLELGRFKLPDDIVDEGLSHIDPERYEQVLNELADKKVKLLNTESDLWKKKNKAVAYLLRKGFETDLVWKAVNNALSQRI